MHTKWAISINPRVAGSIPSLSFINFCPPKWSLIWLHLLPSFLSLPKSDRYLLQICTSVNNPLPPTPQFSPQSQPHSWFPYWTRWAGRFWSWKPGRWEPAGWPPPCSCRRRPAGPLRSGAGWQRWWPGRWTGAPGWCWGSPRSTNPAWRPGTSTSWTGPGARSIRWRRSQCRSVPALGPSGTGSQPGSGPEPCQTGGLNRK